MPLPTLEHFPSKWLLGNDPSGSAPGERTSDRQLAAVSAGTRQPSAGTPVTA